MSFQRGPLICLLVLAVLPGSELSAQSKPPLAGDYSGVLAGSLRVRLHIAIGPDGVLAGTLDSVDQGVTGIPCADFKADGDSLRFSVPRVGGSWRGSLSSDGASLAGTWTQGGPMTLNFTRDTFVPAEKPTAIDGVWLGAVEAAGHSWRAQLKIKSDRAGKEYCAFDSLDQGALDWECTNLTVNDKALSFDVPKVHGRWSGQVSADNQTMTGSWTQASSYPLNFTRRPAVTALRTPEDDIQPPVKVADLGPVLERDLAAARATIFNPGPLAEGTGGGVVVGVVQHGVRRVFAFGTAKPDSIFEIGSVTKTFTGLMLARLVAEGKVKLDEPVRELLPENTVPKPDGPEITLLDLAIQHSGLPRMPSNFHPADFQNPYADYRPADLYTFVASHGVTKTADPGFLYSNLGVGLLGQALANRAGVNYAELLEREIAGPLGLKDTVVPLSREQQARFMQGHTVDQKPAHAWDLDALAGAGAIRSTAKDMLTYLEAQLHPEKFPALATAIVETHELRADSLPGMRIGLAWLYVNKGEFYWHNGGTGGFSSYAFFDPRNDCAAVVLFNGAPRLDGTFSDLLGAHIRSRLLGQTPVFPGH